MPDNHRPQENFPRFHTLSGHYRVIKEAEAVLDELVSRLGQDQEEDALRLLL